MTTDCLDTCHHNAAPTRVHDAILGLAVTVIFIVPATLALFAVL